MARITEPSAGRACLTERERQIACLLADGSTVQEAAQTLGVSPRTVEAHRGNIFRKLGITSRPVLAPLMLVAELS